MAQLSFDGIQPVGFGGKDCTPKINTEMRLRLQNVKFGTEADEEKSDKIMAECFPDDEAYVLDFLKEQMTPFEKQQLRAYLVAGAGGIRVIDEQIANAMQNAMKGAENE